MTKILYDNKEEDMPCKGKRKHTPIVSKKQRGLFGAELKRRKEGSSSSMPGISTGELESHLKESKGKNLSSVSHKKNRIKRKRGR